MSNSPRSSRLPPISDVTVRMIRQLWKEGKTAQEVVDDIFRYTGTKITTATVYNYAPRRETKP